jgi:DNA-binding transcriptional ArsR family regulator
MLKYSPSLDAIFKALGDSGRRAMLQRLEQGEATLGELAQPLAMSLPAVHQHLAVLEDAGLITCEKRGRERWCRLQSETLAHAEDWITQRRQLWDQRLGALATFLASDVRPKPKRRKRK